MVLPSTFKPIEDYEKARISRFDDFKILRNNRKVITMHIGAIVLECWLKSLIIKKFKLDKCGRDPNDNKNYWYNINCSRKRLNPGHRIIQALIDLGFYRHCPVDMRVKLKNISDPLDKGMPSYIDLRYYDDNFISQSDYQKWHRDFREFNKWLMIQFQNSREDFR